MRLGQYLSSLPDGVCARLAFLVFALLSAAAPVIFCVDAGGWASFVGTSPGGFWATRLVGDDYSLAFGWWRVVLVGQYSLSASWVEPRPNSLWVHFILVRTVDM